MRRRLIITGDDFGRTHAINSAIAWAHQHGILTCASLMVNEHALDDALRYVKDFPNLGVGLHLSLIQGRSALPPEEIPLLVNERGEFNTNPVTAGVQYLLQTAVKHQLEREITAQIEKFVATGLVLDHVNGHLHFHLHPTILEILQRVLSRYPVRGVRLTSEPAALNFIQEGGRWRYRLTHAAAFGALCRRARPVFQSEGWIFPDQVFGLLQNGSVTEGYLLKLIPHLPSGTSEIYSHPCIYTSKHEYEALVSPRVRELIQKHRIELIRYQDL